MRATRDAPRGRWRPGGAPGTTYLCAEAGRRARELNYRLIKELWAFTENRIAARFAYEYHGDGANCFRAYGSENWEFDADGLMRRRIPSPASTSARSLKRTGNFTGHSVAGQTNAPA